MTDLNNRSLSSATPVFVDPNPLYSDPGQVLAARNLSIAEKRKILSSWASDTRAVPDAPALRQLDRGKTVSIDAILDALKRLDAGEPTVGVLKRTSDFGRRRDASYLRLPVCFRRNRRDDDDDDDDPPPCPAVSAPWPRPPISGAVSEFEAA